MVIVLVVQWVLKSKEGMSPTNMTEIDCNILGGMFWNDVCKIPGIDKTHCDIVLVLRGNNNCLAGS